MSWSRVSFFVSGSISAYESDRLLCGQCSDAALTVLIPGAFGGGDIKLMAAAGILLGAKLTGTAFFFSVLAGGVYGIYLLAGKKKGGKDHFAFGPFLCLGIWAAICWGNEIIGWYLGLLP